MDADGGAGLKGEILAIIEDHSPAVTFDDLVRSVDFEEEEVLRVIEDLQQEGEIEQDLLLWRGGAHSSATS